MIAREELNVVMVDRSREDPNADPLEPLKDALEHGFSLIIFPEGTRSAMPLPGPFKSGLYHLATEFPQVELIPVYIENLHRSLPKGALLPVPPSPCLRPRLLPKRTRTCFSNARVRLLSTREPEPRSRWT
jgi:1-acyl-sn-glycerol-3-phosphate acyltransferase